MLSAGWGPSRKLCAKERFHYLIKSYFPTVLLTAQSTGGHFYYESLYFQCLCRAGNRDQKVLMDFILWTEAIQHICLITHDFGYLDLIDIYSPSSDCDNYILLTVVTVKNINFTYLLS